MSGGHMAVSAIFPCSVEDGLSPPRPCTPPRAPWRSLVKAGPVQGRPQGLGLDEARPGARLSMLGLIGMAHRAIAAVTETAQAMRSCLLASAMASLLGCNLRAAASIQCFKP